MSRAYSCGETEQRVDGIADAASCVRRGELVVLPTDTVYGIGADAFSPAAVAALLAAKGRGRDMPPPVLVGSAQAARALVEDLGTYGQDLIDEFWPGPLTLVFPATRSLSWDLGDTKGTVALRMPMDPVALDLLNEVGPMAVSSANTTGRPAATTAAEAREQLGDSVSVYLEAGPSEGETPSTIVDLTYAIPRVLRSGAVTLDQLRAVCGTVLGEVRRPRRPASGAEEGSAAHGGATAAGDAAEEPEERAREPREKAQGTGAAGETGA